MYPNMSRIQMRIEKSCDQMYDKRFTSIETFVSMKSETVVIITHHKNIMVLMKLWNIDLD